MATAAEVNVAEVQDRNKDISKEVSKQTTTTQGDSSNQGQAPNHKGNERGQNREGLNFNSDKKVSIRESSTFSWQNIGSWDFDSQHDKVKAHERAKLVENYITDHFFGDWFWNSSIVIGTCFFSWLVARLGGGFLSLVFVLLCASSVYRAELRRFNDRVRDDLSRVNAMNRLEYELETMEWLNSFLDKFWRIYMPALSEQVLYQANLVLVDMAPGFGIDKISLEEFGLGSKAPRIDTIKSYTKKGPDIIEMEWSFSFTPTDTDGFTKKELKDHISPKVVLGVTVGKAFVSKKLPIIVENMSCVGRINIKAKLGNTFPHVQTVSLQFLEPPTIDYGLKPMGGDTFGIDVMSFIPGLSKVVNGLVHSTLRPMLYAPNSLDFDVADFMPDSQSANGLLVITIRKCTALKLGPSNTSTEINPYVELKLDTNIEFSEQTKIKKSTSDPIFMESKEIILHTLENTNLELNVYTLVADKAEDQLIGSVSFPLNTLLQNETQHKVTKLLKQSGKTTGKIEFDLKYHPCVPPKILDDGTKEMVTNVESGILKLQLHEARNLDLSKSALGVLNPYAHICINHDIIKKCRQLHSSNEPTWGQGFEKFIKEQSKTRVQVYVKDAANDAVVGRLDANLQDLIFETKRGQEWITQPPVSEKGQPVSFRITAEWKSLNMTEEDDKTTYFPDASIGCLRLHLRNATDVKNLESVGLVDPYVRVIMNGLLRSKTAIHENTVDPIFNEVTYLPVSNEHQHILLQVMDDEPEGKDRPLGSCAVHVADFVKRDAKGYFLPNDGHDNILEQPILFDGNHHGTLYYSVSFIPTIPVYTKSQIQNWDTYQKLENDKKKEEAEKEAKDQKLFNDHPKEYQWVEINEIDAPQPPKQKISPAETLKYRSGIVAVHLLSGHFKKSDLYVHILFDDQACACLVSDKVESKELNASQYGEAFIRDLPLSTMIVRLGKKFELTHEDQLIKEKVFETTDLLERSKDEPIVLTIDERNKIEVQLEFIPSAVELDKFDTVFDEGTVKLDIVGAENLKAVDSNGKSDPLCVIKVDGKQVYKTGKKRKSLNPNWNESTELTLLSRSRQFVQVEVYDWDYTHEDELIGTGQVDLTGLEPDQEGSLTIDLDTQGKVHLKATYTSKYIRPKLNDKVYIPVDIANCGALPSRAVGSVGDAASGAANNVSGALSKGNNMLKKGLGKSKKNSGSDNYEETDDDSNLDPSSTRNTTESTSSPTKNNDPSVINEESSDQVDENFGGLSSRGSPIKDNNKSLMSDTSSTNGNGHNTTLVSNSNGEMLPPPRLSFGSGRPAFNSHKVNSHSRQASSATDASSFIANIESGQSIPGRVNIISGEGFDSNSLEVKVSLKGTEKTKDLLKTRSSKKSKDGKFSWNESIPFKATIDAQLMFIVREKHTFGKTEEFGTVEVTLKDALQNGEIMRLSAGSGSIDVSIKFESVN